MTATRKHIVEARAKNDRIFYSRDGFRSTTLTMSHADRFDTKEEAYVAMLGWKTEGTDWSVGERRDYAVILVVDDSQEEQVFATAGRSGEVRCGECGTVWPANKAHCVDADRMGCARCNH